MEGKLKRDCLEMVSCKNFHVHSGSFRAFRHDENLYSGQLEIGNDIPKSSSLTPRIISVTTVSTAETSINPSSIESTSSIQGDPITDSSELHISIKTDQTDSVHEEKTDPELFLEHPFKFNSAYITQYSNHYSTDHTGFRDIVDYIFYTDTTLQLDGFLSLFRQKDIEIIGCLPNALIPSDHLPLLAQFHFK